MTTSPLPIPRATSAPASRAERSDTCANVISDLAPSRSISTSASRSPGAESTRSSARFTAGHDALRPKFQVLEVLPSDAEGNIDSAGASLRTRRVWERPCTGATRAGEPVVGANPPSKGGSASSFSASPSANPVGGRKRYAATIPHIVACRVLARAGLPCTVHCVRRIGWREPQRRALPARQEGEDRERPGDCAAWRAGPGRERDRGGQPDHPQAVPLRRRARVVQRLGLRLLRLRLVRPARRRPPALSARLELVHALGL